MHYEKVLKHCRKIVSKKDYLGFKAVLKGVYHFDNTVSATDGKRLIYTEIDDVKFNEYIIDVKSGELLKGKYPATEKMFLKEDSEIQINIDKKTVVKMKRMLSKMKKAGFNYVELVYAENSWHLKPKVISGIDISDVDEKELQFTFAKDDVIRTQYKKMVNIRYLMNALDFIKDIKRANTKLMMTNSGVTPLQFSNQDNADFKYKYLVMPVRCD